MSIRSEVQEELEERNQQTTAQSHESNSNDDEEFHGIGWNILHKKFVEDDL